MEHFKEILGILLTNKMGKSQPIFFRLADVKDQHARVKKKNECFFCWLDPLYKSTTAFSKGSIYIYIPARKSTGMI